jgi:S1/P1 nuclease
VGRGKWDIVHMIPYCLQVLQGRVPEQNERKMTKPIAIILLAHYVADIHQPLHVGAEYFDVQGRPADPAKIKSALADEGGNTLTLELNDEPPASRGTDKKTFHGFWDYDAVSALFPQLTSTLGNDQLETEIEPVKKRLVHEMATHEPPNWRMAANIDINNYAEAWADEILPIARAAHERLQFTNVHPEDDEGRIVASGVAKELPQPDHVAYREWAANVVREELHKAGWRLADLLEKVL